MTECIVSPSGSAADSALARRRRYTCARFVRRAARSLSARARVSRRSVSSRRDLSFVDPESVGSGAIAVEARIRYRHPALPATLAIESGGRARVTFASGGGPAVTPGQACVFYRGDEVVGGGFIERAFWVKDWMRCDLR